MAAKKLQARSKGDTGQSSGGRSCGGESADAEEDDDTEPSALICMPWSAPATFSDDLRGECSECGQAIRYRPHAPKVDRYICLECYQGLASADDHHEITAETVAELEAWLRKQRH